MRLSLIFLALGLTFCGSLLGATDMISFPPDVSSIPTIAPQGDVPMSEGIIETQSFPKASGSFKAVMIFVDFPDAPADNQDTGPVANHLLGGHDVENFFSQESHGRMSLNVTVVPGWRRMSKNVSSYVDGTGRFSFDLHKAYISEACSLFPEISWADFSFVYVVASKTNRIVVSPAFNAFPGTGVQANGVEIDHAVTLGFDSYTNRCTNLEHETLHLFGLPDLYLFNPKPDQQYLFIGGWDMMCDIFHGNHLLGWQRHKLGWLDPARECCLQSGTLQTTLTPLSADHGLSMVVIPVGAHMTTGKVFVVEVAQPITGVDIRNGKNWNGRTIGDGVLIYSVDVNIPTGQGPIRVYPGHPASQDEDEFGPLCEAPYISGEFFDSPAAPMTVRVLKKGQGYPDHPLENDYEVVISRK